MAGRGKGKTPQFPNDLYALGPKGSRVEASDSKRNITIHKPGPSHLIADRKRLGVPGVSAVASGVTATKKPKLTGLPSRPDSLGTSSTSTQDSSKGWENYATDVEPIDIFLTIIEAYEAGEMNKVIAVLCGALKQLKALRIRSDHILCSALMLVAKTYPQLFANEIIYGAICSIMKRESTLTYKSKVNPTTASVMVNLLFYGFQEIKRWPDCLFRLYVEDAANERMWVDSETCKHFTDNILASIDTKKIPEYDFMTGIRTDFDDPNDPFSNSKTHDSIVMPRFKYSKAAIENIAMETVKDYLNRRQQIEGLSKNFLKFLTTMCGMHEVKLAIAHKLEVWLQNPKLLRSTQELLMSICVNCTDHTPSETEVCAAITKIRLKSKALVGYYLSSIKELSLAHPDNLMVTLRQTVINETSSSSRNPNNMQIIAALFQTDPEQAARCLALIFIGLIISKDDILKPLRILFRDIVRHLRADFNIITFTREILSYRETFPREQETRDRIFSNIVDLIILCMFMSIAPYARTEKKDQAQIEKMQTNVANIQCDAVWWFRETVAYIYKPSSGDFLQGLQKIVFANGSENYYKSDNWPPEQDRSMFVKYATEAPLLQNTVLTILIMGLSKDFPINAVETLDLVEVLVKRSAGVAIASNTPVLKAYKTEIVDLLFNLSIYHHPEHIDLPLGYHPPQLAISSLFWKSWIMLLIYSAHEPSVFGMLAWEKYPTLRVLIEMCITNNFVFPYSTEELQIIALERQRILEFESHLAAASKTVITEQNSLLLTQLIYMDPAGPARRPPFSIVEQLQSLNASLKLGHLLCRSRNPDFLVDIIHKQGPTQSMPWLADLVENCHSSLSHLPIQCLCEFLLSSTEKDQKKYQQLLSHLRGLLVDPQVDSTVVCEVLDYFLRRLSSNANKEQALVGLRLLLSFIKDEGEDSANNSAQEDNFILLNKLSKLPHFYAARYQIVKALREACQVENDPRLVTTYLRFLSKFGVTSDIKLKEMTELVVDMAQLLVERSTIMSAILPVLYENDKSINVALNAFMKMFHAYLTKIREPRSESYPLTEKQEQILVVWRTGEDATMHILVIHAMVILLTYGPVYLRNKKRFHYMLHVWFPQNRAQMPKGYLVDTSEEALLLPDWLKLRMIRSTVQRLVEEALVDLQEAQLLLFIQSFGIPVSSMTQLLATLDTSVLENKLTLKDSNLDRAYMIQLIQVQQRRGAIGGRTFSHLLKTLEKNRKIPPPTRATVDLTIGDDDDDCDEGVQTTGMRLSIEQLDHVLDNIHIPNSVARKDSEMMKNRQHLLQMLSTELISNSKSSSYPTVVFKKVINKLYRKCTDGNYIASIITNYHYPTSLFRLLTTAKNKDHISSLNGIFRTISQSEYGMRVSNSPLMSIITTFLSKTTEVIISNEQKEEDAFEKLKNSPIECLEETGEMLLKSQQLKGLGTKDLVEFLMQLVNAHDKYRSSIGLLIGWLVQIEPEIIGSSSELQLDMLFSRKTEEKWISTYNCRPYLLTLLTHHASWSAIHRTVTAILTLEAAERYDPSAVLDFLCALESNPKFWQGREKLTPKHQDPEDTIHLTEFQLICIIKYIVVEVEINGSSSDALNRMRNRLSRLIEIAIKPGDNKFHLSIVNFLNTEFTGVRKEISLHVIAQLYMRVPCIISLIKDTQLHSQYVRLASSANSSSTLDVVSHSVLTSITTNVQEKGWQKRAQDLDIVLRKMAVSHPLLFLRQLSIVETSLMGRVHLEWSVFRGRNHFHLFVQMLNLLEILQPHLFLPEFAISFHSILSSYLMLFKKHGGMSEVGSVLNKFVSLLQSYIAHDADQALHYLQTQSTLLTELQVDHPRLASFCVLMSGMRDSSGTGKIVVAAAPTVEVPAPQLDSIINSLKREDTFTTLQDLEYTSARKPAILEPLLDHIFPFIYDNISYNRSFAHMLITRCIKHNPANAQRVFPFVFNCLQSDKPEIVEAACERIPELIACAQEHAIPILRRLFQAGIKHNINTAPHINRAISLLMLQSSV